MKVTHDQKEVLIQLVEWIKAPPTAFITLGGYAGTGKTTLIGVLRQVLLKLKPNMRIAFCSYTGKATRVLEASLLARETLGKLDSISTIHSLIYSPIVSSGSIAGWRRKQQLEYDLIVIDEASMVDETIFNDLLSFNVPILAIGDHGQLPPIHGTFNLMSEPDLVLEEIHRQAKSNPIIELSMLARTEGVIPVKDYGNGVMKLSRYDSSNAAVVEEKLRKETLDLLILTGFNHTRVKLNSEARKYRDFYSSDPQVGDIVICLKNNWDKNIYNGMVGVVQRIKPLYEADTLQWYEAELLMEQGAVTYSGKISAPQFGSSTTIQPANDQSFDEMGDLFDFGYALTVHKAQGSQAAEVLLFEERSQHMDDEAWRRWLYTGITRAEERLVIVGQ